MKCNECFKYEKSANKMIQFWQIFKNVFKKKIFKSIKFQEVLYLLEFQNICTYLLFRVFFDGIKPIIRTLQEEYKQVETPLMKYVLEKDYIDKIGLFKITFLGYFKFNLIFPLFST